MGRGVIYKVEFYQSERGDCPTQEFLESLETKARAKAAAWLGLLKEKGPNLHRPYSDVLESPIRELRISHGRLEIRLLYFIHDQNIVMTHGFLKKTREVPAEEIERAKRHRNEWLRNEGGGQK